MPRPLPGRIACAAAIWLTLVCAFAERLAAHEIPSDVTIRVIVLQEQQRLRIAVRTPLDAMRDIEFPTLGPGYLDIPRAEGALRDAALLWLADALDIRAGSVPLERPRLVSVPAGNGFERTCASAAA